MEAVRENEPTEQQDGGDVTVEPTKPETQPETAPTTNKSEEQEKKQTEEPQEPQAQPQSQSTPVKEQPKLSQTPSMTTITPHKSALAQMDSYLAVQAEKFSYYKSYFDNQGNITMASKFESLATVTLQDQETLRQIINENGELPRFNFDYVRMSCVPANVDVKEKELQIVIKTSNLPVEENSLTYIIAEFEFPVVREETVSESIGRWAHSVKIEPKNLICCSRESNRQLDIIYSTDVKPFFDPESKLTEYDRPLTFFVDKGKSRTLKRKFKPVKLTFYEKTSFVRCDKKLGTVQIKIDGINEDASIVSRLPIMNGRKQTEASAEVRVKVREPLVEKTIRTHSEKMLVLT